MHSNALYSTHSELAQIEHEITQLETRLSELALHDDCAYEKAMVRTYEGMLDDRRRRLAQLRQAI